MNWTEIIMDVATGAIIGAALGLVGVVITDIFTDFKGYKKVAGKIGDTTKASLSHQHEDIEKNLGNQHKSMEEHLSGQHMELQNRIDHSSGNIMTDIRSLKEKLDSGSSAVSYIENTLLVQQEKEKSRYDSLNDKQKDIKNNIDAIHLMAKDWEKLNAQNKEISESLSKLQSQYSALERDYRQLSQECENLKMKNRNIESENNSLRQENSGHDRHRGFPPISF